MYVIFPADEVVYLSYGRVIYIPQSDNRGRTSSNININNNNNINSSDNNNPNLNNHIETSDRRQSVRSHTPAPSLPSTSTTTTGSSRSTIRSSIGGTTCNNNNNGCQSDTEQQTKKNTNNNKLKRNKSRSSRDSKDSEEKPIRPQRYKKIKETSTHVTDSKKDNQYLQVPNNHSGNSNDCDQEEPRPRRGGRRLSFTDFLPLRSSGNSPKRSSNKTNSLSVNFDDSSSATRRSESFHSSTERPIVNKRNIRFGGINLGNRRTEEMATTHESALKELTHPSYNEFLKQHNSVTFKLTKTVSDFTQQLGQIYEQHAEELQVLVSNFRKRNAELRKERPACPSSLFHTWETLLQEVEIDSQALGDIASILGRQVSRPLLERSFFRKIQSRKVFTHRESYETIIAKTEEKLAKCRQEYKSAYLSYLTAPTTSTLSAYFNSHNAYVQQLHATNGMMDEFSKETLPQLLQELEEIYTDLCSSVSDSILQGAEVVSSRSMEQYKRYESLISQCKAVSGPTDIAHVARALPPPQGRGPIMKRPFVAPQPPPPPDPIDGTDAQDIANSYQENIPPPLKDELVIDRLSAVQVKPSYDALKKEAIDLETQIRQIQDSLDTLVRIQQRSLEASLFNKANEIQEDISMKRFDLRVAQLHLSAIHSQKELFAQKLDSGDTRERKMSSASQGSMKNKWLKAFKSLKTPPPESEKKNGSAATRELLKGDPDAHNFQEYTYKKITPCDVCSQVLRGHTRQGLKCRICKMNVHVDCQEKASKCQTKARLLRRQKSTSEIETRVPESTEEEMKLSENYSEFGSNRHLNIKDANRLHPATYLENTEVDLIYQVLKQAGEISNSKSSRVNVVDAMPTIAVNLDSKGNASSSNAGSSSGSSSGQSLNRRTIAVGQNNIQPTPPRGQATNLTVINPAPCSTSSAPHSPRRQKLNLRMKSLSLDSPESTEHAQRRKHHGAANTSDPHSNQSSSSRIQSPSSPVHNRRLLSAKNIRMSSVELPDDNEKSPSSASTSPCPSPVGAKKSHRLLPTNLYVVLYNFKARHQDELDLKAGYKVTVIDTSDPDWWKGKCLGKVGYFPSKYCSKLSPGEKPLQVTHNLQVSDGDNGLMLLRDQIVIQIGEELDGMVMIRSGDNRQGVCPVKFLQEV